jgi:uncharacterized protein YceK/plastocyanin
MRSILLSSIVGLIVTGCGDVAGSDMGTPPPAPVVTVGAAITESGDGQSGTVATTLSLPLRVAVDSAGIPQAGVKVTWTALGGTLEPQSSVTDAGGVATTRWTLDTVSGGKAVSAVVAGVKGSPVTFKATALAGPASILEKVAGDTQSVASNRQFHPLSIRLTDQYHNKVSGQIVTWTVESGPLTILSQTVTTDGISTAQIGNQGAGPGTVRASLTGSSSMVEFSLNIDTPEGFLVLLNQAGAAFSSAQNNSTNPAVDTITAGQTMEFKCRNFDYDAHRLVSVGQPSFEAQDFSYYCESRLIPLYVTFTTPGTYRYTDFYFPKATGTIVVQ